jgi:hypothetical protein
VIGLLATLAIGAGSGGLLTALVPRLLKRRGKSDVPSAANPPPPVEWKDEWNDKTVQAAHEAMRTNYAAIHNAVGAVDTKAVTLFVISSAIVSLVPSLHQLAKWSPGWWLGAGAAVSWVVAVMCGWQAFRPRRYLGYPDPDWIARQETLSLQPHELQAFLLESARRSFKHDRQVLQEKGSALKLGLIFAGLEVALLVLALLVS